MYKKILLMIVLVFLLIPVCVKAENKIYFEENNVSIVAGDTYDIDIKVNSDFDFSKVDFDIKTSSNYIKIEDVKINNDFTNGANNGYSLYTNIPQKSRTTIATVTIKVEDDAPIGSNGTIKIVNPILISNKQYNLNLDLLNVAIENSHTNYLKSLSSDIVDIDFKKDVFSYNVEVDDVDTFDLVATPLDKNANVEISSQKLINRKNIISVKVSQKDLDDVVYNVIVLRKDYNQSNDYNNQKSKQIIINQKKQWTIILGGLLVSLLVNLIVINRKKRINRGV